MTDEKNTKQAQQTFSTLCKMLDTHEIHYQKDLEELKTKCTIRGDDLPMDLNFRVDSGRMLVSLMSFMPVQIAEEKRAEMAVIICKINYLLVDGTFDYDLSDGTIIFRISSSFRGSLLGEELFEYMLYLSARTIDKYNDKFFMFSKGLMDMDQFFAEKKEGEAN